MADEPSQLGAAIHHFPNSARTIEEMASQSKSFRDMCEDLAESERALALTEGLPAEIIGY